MEFIIQDNLMNVDQLLKIKKAVQKYPHRFVGVVPFSHEITTSEPLEGVDFIPYGSTLLTNITSGLGWTGTHFDLNRFNYRACLLNRDDMMNSNVLNINEAIGFLRRHGSEREWFLRPSEDLKQFSGQVMQGLYAADWLCDALECESSGSYRMEPTMDIVVSPPINILSEYRWFIVGNRVVSGSMYRCHGLLLNSNVDDDIGMVNEAQAFADKWLPDPCCVMDLAHTEDGVKVIEFNRINASGFYSNNIPAVFDALWQYHRKD